MPQHHSIIKEDFKINKDNNLVGTSKGTSKLAQLRQKSGSPKTKVNIERAIEGYASSIDSQKMMEEIARNSALVNLVIDNSPSMEGTSESIAEEINGFATRQGAKIYNTKISLTLFNTEVCQILNKMDAKQFVPVSPWWYDGGTNIYDALISAITPVFPTDANHRLHLIVTDGENGGSNHTQQEVRNLTASRAGEYIFLLYHDKYDRKDSAKDYAVELGIDPNNAVNFKPYGDGIKIIFQTIEALLDGLRTTGAVPKDWAKAIAAHNANPLGVKARDVKLLN